MPGFTLEANFDLTAGERAALTGPSGVGKTTLLRMIAGLEPTDQGQIFLGDQDISQMPPEARQMGYVFQDFALFESLGVLENITFGLKVRGQSKRERDEIAQPWLELLKLKSLAQAPIYQLSGGEKQRVAFARALIWKPKLLLLDEPFSAVDAELRGILRESLLEAHRLWPVVMLLVTHDEADAQALATRRLKFVEEKTSAGLSIRSVKKIDQP